MHVHLLLSEPEPGSLAVVLQMLKQIVSCLELQIRVRFSGR
jgi:hypothetical protein